MKLIQRVFAGLLCVLAVLAGTPPAAAAPAQDAADLTILFTHDTHDHFYPDAGGLGGYTRLAALLEERRVAAAAQGRAVVTLDGGDFSMGSLFQTVYATDAPELRALGAMGYDAVTLGNHEFDYRQTDHLMIIRTTLSKWVMCSDLSFLLRMRFDRQRAGIKIPALYFFFRVCYNWLVYYNCL